ncbi:hypothetical protein QFZ77_004636 [Paenibacillus sp. V4I3]|uniref:spore germination protein n=1 Tax=unclassified Paenibacillus TaxID=185978 RepID=UPI0027804DFA|nr:MULTISPECIES: spore germination protein [unclassified Paenibacillus]MDQ0875977.1 hypothetical protein [Paenibacillus sp. V4I3]MDQ0888007.1 hypothetical protein [Paenibacillus sp. V4I9]
MQVNIHATTTNIEEMAMDIVQGCSMPIHSSSNMTILFKTTAKNGRQASAPEIESQIIGPQNAFVESIEQNLQTITQLLPDLYTNFFFN